MAGDRGVNRHLRMPIGLGAPVTLFLVPVAIYGAAVDSLWFLLVLALVPVLVYGMYLSVRRT